jgi:hypothetical protein
MIGFPLALKRRYNSPVPNRAIGLAKFHAYMQWSQSMM